MSSGYSNLSDRDKKIETVDVTSYSISDKLKLRICIGLIVALLIVAIVLTVLWASDPSNGAKIVVTWICWMISFMVLFMIGTRTKQDNAKDDDAQGYYE